VNPLDPADAELSLLACIFQQPRWLDVLDVTEADFYQPRHGELWNRFAELHRDDSKPDPVNVGPHLSTLFIEVATNVLAVAGNAEHYAGVVKDASVRRSTLNALDGLRSRLNDLSIPLDQALAEVERALTKGADLEAAAAKLETLDEFLDRPRPPQRWVIPDLLTVGDRLVLTGAEGFGKSVCMRQIGVMAACGLHPFALRNIPPQKVLLVDCENPEEIMADVLGTLRDVARRRSVDAGDRFWLIRYPQGLDLSKPKDRLELHRQCMLIRPDLLLIGPAYKLYVGGGNQREVDLARQVTSALDGLREEFGFALILEHHSPHASGTGERVVRPIGSSLWLRWPEFGLGLAPNGETEEERARSFRDRKAVLRPWRGARADRPWPKFLHASQEPGALPWADPHALHHR